MYTIYLCLALKCMSLMACIFYLIFWFTCSYYRQTLSIYIVASNYSLFVREYKLTLLFKPNNDIINVLKYHKCTNSIINVLNDMLLQVLKTLLYYLVSVSVILMYMRVLSLEDCAAMVSTTGAAVSAKRIEIE